MEMVGDDMLIGGKYKVGRQLGSGTFGDVYAATDLSNGEVVAIKIERSNGASRVVWENQVYAAVFGAPGIPKIHWLHTSPYGNVLVMDLLGPSLEDLFISCGKRFSLKTVLMLSDQMLERVKCLHSKHYIHRDIKPENFTMGLGRDCNKLHIIDFGLADKYYSNYGHIRPGDVRSLFSTPRYASVNALHYRQTSRRDDLESLGYCFMYFLLGRLPWQGMLADSKKQKYERIGHMKITCVEAVLKDYPAEFMTYMNYVRSLRFEETPDYEYMRGIFGGLFTRMGYRYDFNFDWNVQGRFGYNQMPAQ